MDDSLLVLMATDAAMRSELEDAFPKWYIHLAGELTLISAGSSAECDNQGTCMWTLYLGGQSHWATSMIWHPLE